MNRKIRLLRSILIKGEHHDKGTVLRAPAPLAHSLVGDGSAEWHEDEADKVAADDKAGLKVQEPIVAGADADIKVLSKPEAKGGSKPAPAPKKQGADSDSGK